MLSDEPFFEMDEAVCSAMVSNLLRDSDAEEQTDVPLEQSLPTSLNDSEEDRRSPMGEAQRRVPLLLEGIRYGQASSSTAGARPGPVGLELTERRWLPPGLSLSSSETPCFGGAFGSQEFALPSDAFAPMFAESSRDKADDSADDEADDEGSQPQLVSSDPSGLTVVPPNINGYPSSHEDEAYRLWLAQLPSIGSANHFNGTCDRCCFHPKGRCLNGYNCQHCHFDHEKRKRTNKKKVGGKALELLSTSEGSIPVSPERTFGPGGMLSTEVDYHPDNAGMPSGFHQPPQFYGPLSTNRPEMEQPLHGTWYPPNTVPSEMCGAALPHTQDGSLPSMEYLSTGQPVTYVPAPGDVRCPDPQYPVPQPDRRDEYIRQLEVENRYLRSCLQHYMGPNAGSLLPPPLPLAETPPHIVQQAHPMPDPSLPHNQYAPMSSPPAVSSPPAAHSSTTQSAPGMSASAAPFWPSTQAWGHAAAPVTGDASTRSVLPGVYAGGPVQ